MLYLIALFWDSLCKRGTMDRKKVSVLDILASKGQKKICMITCYDALSASLINQTDIDMVLVGDSVGNVMMGYSSTIKVTLEDMIHYTSCVSRGLDTALLVADLPFMSYKKSMFQALDSSARLIQEGGASAVKLEGGVEIAQTVEKITSCGIPVVAHVGFTPQSIHSLGGFKIQGKTEEKIKKLKEDVLALEQAGAFCIVLELMPCKVARELTSLLSIPTIGIGAGSGCDGQVLVFHDMLGYNPGFKPKFLKTYANLSSTIIEALSSYCKEVRTGVFPDDTHSY